jgi:hypothetical protein
LLGTNVAKACGVYPVDMLVWNNMTAPYISVVPHPSGVNSWYNDAKNKSAASAFLVSLFSDCKFAVAGTVLTKADRAKNCTQRLEEYDRRSDWVDLAMILVECERDKLFLEVGSKTWDEWLQKHAPRSYRLCYMVKAQYKALEGSLTLEEMRKIPPETARWAAKSKNISPAALKNPDVKAALFQPRRKAIAALQTAVPEQHIEDTRNHLLKFDASQDDAVLEGYGAFKLFKDEKSSLEDFIEFCVSEWMESEIEAGVSYRQRLEEMKGIVHDQAQEKAASNVAAL